MRETARLASVGLPHACDWLNVMPSPILGLHMKPAEFVASVKYTQCVPVFSSAGRPPAVQDFASSLAQMLTTLRAISSNQHHPPQATETAQSHTPRSQPSDHGYALAQSPPTQWSQSTTQQSEPSQGLPLPQRHELPTLEEVHTKYIPTIRWCPKAARGEFTQ